MCGELKLPPYSHQTYLQRIALTCMLKIKYKIEKRAIKEAKNGR
jgi:hypothetical protein